MVLLTVPYAEKNAAKALGARWNPTRRRWYVPDGVASEPFAKWLDGAPDGKPGPATGSAPGKSGRVDSYQGKTVVGANFVDLAHDCSPLQACPSCGERLAGSPWMHARAGLQALVAAMPGTAHGRDPA